MTEPRRRTPLRLGVAVATLLVCTSAAAETYDSLTTQRVWEGTLAVRTTATVRGVKTLEEEQVHLFIATAPQLAPAGRLALLVARSHIKRSVNGAIDDEWQIAPPTVVHLSNGFRELAKPVPVHIAKPPLHLGGELRLAPSGKVEAHFLGSRHTFDKLEYLALLWPELPAKLAVGQSVTSRRSYRLAVGRDPVSVDVETRVGTLRADVVELELRAGGGTRISGRARVRLKPTELVALDVEIVDATGTSHVTLELTSRGDLVLAPLLGPILDD